MNDRARNRLRHSRRAVGIVSAVIAALFHVNSALATGPDPRAQRALDAALKAHGGPEAWNLIESLSILAKGQVDQSGEIQGLHPDKPCLRSYEEKLFYQASTQSVSRAVHAPRNDFSLRWRQTILREDERMFIDFVSRSARRSMDPKAPSERQGFLRRIPHFTLQEVRSKASSLRWVGNEDVKGRNQDVIAYTLDTGDEMAIFIDAEAHTVTRFEMKLDFPTLGNVVLEWVFPEHRPIGLLGFFPVGHTVKVGGRTYVEVTYDKIEVNESLPPDAFAPPPDIALPPPPEPRQEPTPQPPQVEEIADGVFFVTRLGSFNTMFVELSDFVLAVEAPANYPLLETIPPANVAPASSLGEKYLEIIKNTVPGKPVRHLALSHHHSDHIGGAEPFIAEGATLITTPGNLDFVRRMAEAVDVPEALVETFENKRVVTDGRKRVELIDIGANPHTEEMIVVWIPEEGILFQGDLFYPIPLDYFPPTGRTIIMRHFAEWLRENQISPERIYGVHGPWYGTDEHLNKLATEAQQQEEASK